MTISVTCSKCGVRREIPESLAGRITRCVCGAVLVAPSRDNAEKVCCACGINVSRVKRVKDQRGRYYCEACFAASGGRSGLLLSPDDAQAQRGVSAGVMGVGGVIEEGIERAMPLPPQPRPRPAAGQSAKPNTGHHTGRASVMRSDEDGVVELGDESVIDDGPPQGSSRSGSTGMPQAPRPAAAPPSVRCAYCGKTYEMGRVRPDGKGKWICTTCERSRGKK